MELKTTKDLHLAKVSVLVYGQSGAGKTSLIKTLEKPLVLSAEGGLLCLAGTDIPYLEIKSIEDLRAAYNWLTEEKRDFKTICLDSISEIAEVVLISEKKATKDGRAAYGNLADIMTGLIRAFRDLPGYDVYFSAKQEKSQDEDGKVFYGPSMPGKTLTQGIEYFFDEVFALRIKKDEEGNVLRALMTSSNGLWSAKDRSGKLEDIEPADLGSIIRKIRNA